MYGEMEAKVDNDIPQWKKDLIARLRSQNRTVAAAGSGDQQLYTSPQHSSSGRAGHQPSLTCKSESVTSGVPCSPVSEQCNVNSTTCSHPLSKMVQERVWVDSKHDPFVDMVSDNYGNNGYHKDSDSDSSEDLHYGPGIVNKLKNKYLSLALRESNVRPSILHMRKATSLENLLDDDVPNGPRQFQSRRNGNDTGKNVPNRYRNATRGEMKRARSVEAISRFDHHVPLISAEVRPNRQSLHEEMLIAAEKEGSDHPHRKAQDNQLETNTENKFNSNHVGPRINRPKRIQPIMNEKEKPPADVVKQTKKIFERRPEQRTKAPPQTGDVAAKVDSFNNIIVKSKVEAKVSAKKPPIKHTKPVLNDKVKSNTRPSAKPVVVSEETIKSAQVITPPRNLALKKDFKEDAPLPSPIPDVSRIDFHNKGENERGKNITSLSETPDLILTSSPLPAVTSPTYKRTDNFLKDEIRNSSPIPGLYSPLLSPTRALSPLLSPRRNKPASPLLSPNKPVPTSPSKLVPASPILSPSPRQLTPTVLTFDDFDSCQPVVSPSAASNTPKQASGSVFNFTNQTVNQSHLPVNKNVCEKKTPPLEPLKIEINGHKEAKVPSPTPKLQAPKFTPPKVVEKTLTVTEIEKNLINTVKTLQQPGKTSVVCVNASVEVSVEVVNKNVVPKKSSRSREPASNTAVFNFTSRKDVPDYISNDRSRTPGRPELPKPGEGGIILIPGATISDSFTDEDEEILRSLEGPPSPCDVTFVNDNILIDGKSSLSQKTKRTKLRISFVEAGPEIYEYPSETSLMLDESPTSPAQVGHTVPLLGGSSLANYTPKGTEDFQPGVTRSVQPHIPSRPDVTEVDSAMELLLEEIEKPFSLGTNADILF